MPKKKSIKKVAVRFGAPIDPTLEDARERLEEAVRGLIGDGTFGSIPPIP